MTYDWEKVIENKARPTKELIEAALAIESGDAYWEIVIALYLRETEEVFELSKNLCQSNNPVEKALGIDILGQLGSPNLHFREQSIKILLDVFNKKDTTKVLNSIAVAFGHLKAVETIKLLSDLKNHSDADVRFGVVFGLLTYEDELAVKTLVELSSDEDVNVRDWATFGLGILLELDNQLIREALFARIEDTDHETRGEAFVGLAKRKDERVIEPLLKELVSNSVGVLAVEAAKEFGDIRFYPALLKLKEWWVEDDKYLEELLEEALQSCKMKD